MNRSPIVIWGASGHARVVIEIVKLANEFTVVGLIDDHNPDRAGELFAGHPILGGQEQLPILREKGVENLIVAIGINEARLRLGRLATEHGFYLTSAVHPAAIVAHDTVIGPGTVIKALAAIDPDVVIGKQAIIGSGASVGHGCRIGRATRLSGGVHIAGETRIGDLTSIASGASIRDRITIGDRCLVGVGAVVVGDLPAGVVAYGNPARIIRPTKTNDAG